MSGRRDVHDEARRTQVPRLYCILLHLLPRWFRGRHSAAMQDAFAALYVEALRAGSRAILALWWREAWDLLRTGLSLRVGGARRRRAATATLSPAGPLSRRRLISAIGMRDDLRHAIRALWRRPAFVALAAGTLALGIGSTTAMYSALKAVVLDPLPFREPDRLVELSRVMGSAQARALLGLRPEHIATLREQRETFEGLENYWGSTATLTGGHEPERVYALAVSEGLPALLGVGPVLGRSFHTDELSGDGARVVMLSHALWRGRFGGAGDVLGRTMHLDGDPWTIIGVMPRTAMHPSGRSTNVDLWLPLPESNPFRTTIARLAPDVTVEMAAARVDAVVRRSGENPLSGTAELVQKPEMLHGHLRMLMIAVVLLLLVACVNVSHLLLQRAAARSRETAVRLALGAAPGRLIRQSLLDAALLALVGGLAGAALAYGVLHVLPTIVPEQLEMLRHVRIDGGVLLFTLAATAVTGILFGVIPAMHATRARATAALGRHGRGAGTGPTRMGWPLVTLEVALSFALLIGAALVLGSLRDLASRDPGYRADELIAIDVRLPAWRYGEEPLRTAAFQRMVDAARRMPSVRSVSLATGVPPQTGGARFGRLQVEGAERDAEPSIFHSFEVDSAFFRAVGQPLLAGRAFTAGDAGSGLNPVILAESAAKRLFPGENALGRRFAQEGTRMYTVVGIARDILIGLTDDGRVPLAYWPIERVRDRMLLAVRADRQDAAFLLELRGVVRDIEPDAIASVQTVNEMLGGTLARERFTTMLLGAFAAMSLVLAAVGLYGVLSQVVLARTHEIGVRMALGADAPRIRRLVLRSGLAATAVGLLLGGALATAGLRVMRSEVFGLGDARPAAYAAAALVLVGVAVVAMLVPALRAARLDPVRAIRAD